MEKKKESRSGMEIMNLLQVLGITCSSDKIFNLKYFHLQKEGRQRGTWNGKKADSDFSKMIVRRTNFYSS